MLKYLHILNHSPGFSSKSFVYFSLETQLFQFVRSAAHKLFYCSFFTMYLCIFENLFCRETLNFSSLSNQIKKENSFLLIYLKETYTFDNYLVKLEEYFVNDSLQENSKKSTFSRQILKKLFPTHLEKKKLLHLIFIESNSSFKQNTLT